MSRKFLIVMLWRQIVEVHRISAAFYLNYRCASKEFGNPPASSVAELMTSRKSLRLSSKSRR